MAKKVFNDRWEVIRSIEEGGQSWIYEVCDKSGEFSGSKLLKRLKNVKRIERFKREIEAGRQLDHPAIAPILDYSLEGDSPYFVTELYDGHTGRFSVFE